MGEGVLAAPVSSPAAAGWSRAADSVRCDAVPVDAIATAAGTPVYAYSASLIREQYARLTRALAPVPHRVHYSAKANSSHSLLALLRGLGAGVDIVSGGELFRATRAGFAGADIVFSGVGKTERELREALAAEVLLVNVESGAELRLLARVASQLGVIAPVALRVNPEVVVDTPHHYTRTGERGNKFGIPFEEARAVARLALSLPSVRLAGLDMHIGSQVSRLDPYQQGMQRLLALYLELRADGAQDIRYLDLGGGLAVTYDDELPMDVDAFARAIVPAVAESGLTLIVEPGRFLIGNAGALVTRVLYRKSSGGHEYVIVDAGMTELLRPSHYNAFHRIEVSGPSGASGVFDIVGPVCESGDFFALDRTMASVDPGALLVVHSAGAYGIVMASTYNSRPRVPEVLVDGDRFAIITERETYDDLVRHEPTTPVWRSS
ncbi:MAG: diaminopimelate decarboxylase [Gemmatimonadaceae bacterium]